MSTTDLKAELELARNAYNLALEGSRLQGECEERVNALYAEVQAGEEKTLEQMSNEELGEELVARIQATNYNLEAPEVLEVALLIEARENAAKADARAKKATEEAASYPKPGTVERLRLDIGTEYYLQGWITPEIRRMKRQLAKMEAERAK